MRASCQDHLRKLALAVNQYVEDQGGGYPAGSRWNEVLSPYAKTKEVFHCPSVPSRTGETDYWLNPKLNKLKFGRGKHETDPAGTFLNSDLSPNSTEIKTNCGVYKYYVRHLKGANYSFVDGHVKWLKPQDAAETECGIN